MKLLVVTRADENIEDITRLTHPILERYAAYCGADFKVLDGEPPVWTDERPTRPHFRIMEIKDLLQTYDRVLCLDSDILIRHDCPSLFDVVHPDLAATVFEDKGPRTEERRQKMALIQSQWGDVGWTHGSVNSGVFLVSAKHADIFEPYQGRYWTGEGSDDVHLGFMLHYRQHALHELEYRFNHMSMHSEEWNGSPSRFDSYILHYAGGVIRKDQLKRDFKHLKTK